MTSSNSSQFPQGPLTGRTIIDCSALLPGPFIGKLLALQGAKVIKVENPHVPDGAKAMGSFYDDLNELKEIVPLDLKSDADRIIFRSYIEKADGLVEGFRPQAKARLGLDEKSLHAVNPHLAIVSLVGYPEDGPKKDRAGHDINFQALTGCLSLFNEMPALPLADLFAAYRGALAMASALDSVARHKKGIRTVIAMDESLTEVQSVLIRDFQTTGIVPRYRENLFSGLYPCYREYKSKDGKRIAVGAIEQKFWDKICELIKKPDLKNKGYATGKEGEKICNEIQETFGAQPWSYWKPLFEKSDCCVEPVLDYSEIFRKSP